MTSLYEIGGQVLIATLKADAEVLAFTEVVKDGFTYHRIYLHTAPESDVSPTITLSYIRGGFDNRAYSLASDVYYKVVTNTADKSEGLQGMSLIEKALQRTDPVIPPALVGEVIGYHWIENWVPVSDHYARQKSMWYEMGGIYRLQLSHNTTN